MSDFAEFGPWTTSRHKYAPIDSNPPDTIVEYRSMKSSMRHYVHCDVDRVGTGCGCARR